MKIKLIKTATVSLLLICESYQGYSQGSFVNLNFETPLLPLTPINFQVPITNAIPGWRGYLGVNEVDKVFYNTVSIGAAAISLQSSLSTFPPIAGNYSVILQGQFNPNNVPGLMSAAVAQSGQIPAGSQSLRFYSGSESMQATFAGQNVPLVQLGITGGYLVLGGDISGFAGLTGELRFTMPSVAFSYTIPYLDNITFSSETIPEPSTLGLFGIGALLFSFRSRLVTKS